MADIIDKKLKANEEADYGSEYKAHCLEIYKLYVEKADAISSRRQSANSFFLTINTAIIGAIGYIGTSVGDIKLTLGGTGILLGCAGIALCVFWCQLIRSYRQMNNIKFEVIREIEKELPLSPYNAEWEALGAGEKPKLYKPFTSVELAIPCLFLIVYGACVAFLIFHTWL